MAKFAETSTDLRLPERPVLDQIPTFQKEGDAVIMLVGGKSYWLTDRQARKTRGSLDRVLDGVQQDGKQET